MNEGENSRRNGNGDEREGKKKTPVGAEIANKDLNVLPDFSGHRNFLQP